MRFIRSCWLKCYNGKMVGLRDTSKAHYTNATLEAQNKEGLTDKQESPSLEQLRQCNCWRLWNERGLSVQEISFLLQIEPSTVINNIVSCAFKHEGVNWGRLSNSVGMTADIAKSVLLGRAKAKSSSKNVLVLSVPDIVKLCPRNVTGLHVALVHVMLRRGLSASEIIDKANITATGSSNENFVNQTESFHRPESPCDFKDFVDTAKRDRVIGPVHFGADEAAIALANGDADFRSNELYKYVKDGGIIKKTVTKLGILQFLENNAGAPLAVIAKKFEDCDEKHLMRLLLDLLDSHLLVQEGGNIKFASKNCLRRVECWSNSFSVAVTRRVLLARSLNAKVLGFHIREPRRDVSFLIFRPYTCNGPRQYVVRVCKHPSCTCPDFSSRRSLRSTFLPCKHLLYVYMKLLNLGTETKDVMCRSFLPDTELLRMLEAYQ